MKKTLTILLSLIMAISVCFGTNIFALAETNTLISPQTTTQKIVIKVTLNGDESVNTTYTPDKDEKGVITFTYTGGGELIGWDFPDQVEGVDYIIVSRDENSITIKILDPDNNTFFWANAKDKYPETTKPVKKDDGSKSPNTGATTGLGVLGAGVVLLAITRKKR